MATIEVGDGEVKRTFYAHRGLLTFYSGYFKAALEGGFAEAQSGVIKLETEEPSVFEAFITWLYTRKACAKVINPDTACEHYELVVKLWIFANRRDIPLLMNEMVDSLHRAVVDA